MKNEWVKVSDDMPPLDQVVITWDGYTLGMDYSDYCVDAGDVYFANLKEVTHWSLIDTEDELTDQLEGESKSDKNSVNSVMNGNNPAFSVSMSDEQVRVCTGAVVDHDILISALTEISNMCIGDLTMNYSIDSQYIGELIYKSTGLTNPELNEFVGQLEDEYNE